MKRKVTLTVEVTLSTTDELELVGDLERVAAAVEKIRKDPDNYIIEENESEVYFDDECPYGTLPNEN